MRESKERERYGQLLGSRTSTDVRVGYPRRRRLGLPLLVSAVLFCAVATRPAHGQIALIQKNLGTFAIRNSAGTTSTINPASDVTDGRSVIVTFAMLDASGTVTCSDDSLGGHTYSIDADVSSGTVRTVICSAHNVQNVTTATIITVTHPSASARAMSASEFAGLAGTGTLDQTNTSTGTVSPATTGTTASTTANHELLIGAIGVNGPSGDTFTPTTPWNMLERIGSSGGSPTSNITINPEYQFVYTTGTYQGGGTLGNDRAWAGAIATYKSSHTGLYSKVGTLSGGTTSVTGVGFQPRAVIFFWNTLTAAGYGNGAQSGYGFATGPGSERVVAYASGHNVASSGNSKRWQSSAATSRCIAFFTSAGTIDGYAQMSSMDSDGFTLSWPSSPSSAYLVHYIALGGADITNATVGSFTPNTGVSPPNYQFNGVGFQPDFLMFLSIDSNTLASSVNDGRLSIGVAGLSGGSTITQGGLAVGARNSAGVSNVTSSRQHNAAAIIEKDYRAGSSGNTFEASVASFDANGFSINKTVNADQTIVHYMALRGGQYKVGSLLKSSLTAAPPDYTDTQEQSAVGFRPHGLLFISKNYDNPSNGPNQVARIAFGAADTRSPMNERSTWFEDHLDNPADPGFYDNTFVRQGTSTTKSIVLAQVGDCPSLIADPGPNNSSISDCINGPDSGGVRITAEVNVAGHYPNGFDLTWTKNLLAVPVNQGLNEGSNEDNAEILYVAFGNDETTAVDLTSFTATGEDGAVLLEWKTGSELGNLGFHLYRSLSEEGPYERITASPIPGLGSSPEGASYSYRDSNLTNAVTYFYKLEDIETTGATEMHGPVSATPQAGLQPGTTPSPSENEAPSLITFGDPSVNSFRVLEWSQSGATVELLTQGFFAEPLPDGSVRLSIPLFEPLSEPNSPSIPVTRPWVDAVAGVGVRLVSAVENDIQTFRFLRPSGPDQPLVFASPRGVVQRGRTLPSAALDLSRIFPALTAEILSTGFQGDIKKAELQIAPLRWDGIQLRLARRVVVQIAFTGRAPGETRRGLPYRPQLSHGSRSLLARLRTTQRALHVVHFEQVFPQRKQALPTASLRLSRLGQTVSFHVEPNPDAFGPRSRLYFFSPGPDANPYGSEAVFELELSNQGLRMETLDASPSGPAVSNSWKHSSFEQNRMYQSGLLQAPDRWVWDWLFATDTEPSTKRFPFQIQAIVSSPQPSRLSVWLQGGTDFEAPTDHHVRVVLNGTLVAEATWEGMTPHQVDVEIPFGLLTEGTDTLEIENVGDAGAPYSMVFLDRFSIDYPQSPVSTNGQFEGRFSDSGTVAVQGAGPGYYLVDITDTHRPVWLTGAVSQPDGTVLFRADAGHLDLLLRPDTLANPVVQKPLRSALKSTRNRADYLLIAPRRFLDEAKPLLDLRAQQGLLPRAVAVEQVFEDFGFGETRPQALQDFISYAYHHWSSPRLRYVLLLGDATFDFKDYLQYGVANQVPPLIVPTSYIWTVSDPTLAAVNGADILPDVAIGRLPAANEAEVQTMVQKILDFENGLSTSFFSSPFFLVADNPDTGGNFVADADSIASGVLAGHDVRKLYLGVLDPTQMRAEILQAFDQGASLMSYIGHGAIRLWANETILDIDDVASLSPQPQQPLLITMTCLTGYFHFPPFNSISEELLKAEHKGAIAAFSPSGLSEDDAAHVFHRELLEELLQGGHGRLGDALLAAQGAYAASGALPELLSIYHLLGDPALTVR